MEASGEFCTFFENTLTSLAEVMGFETDPSTNPFELSKEQKLHVSLRQQIHEDNQVLLDFAQQELNHELEKLTPVFSLNSNWCSDANGVIYDDVESYACALHIQISKKNSG